MLKKIMVLLICGIIVCGLTGCGIIWFNDDKEKKSIDPAISPRRYSSQILHDVENYLKYENAEALCSLFSVYANVSTHKVQGLLDFIDGEIVSIDNASIKSGGGKKRDGKYTYYAYNGRLIVKTDKEVKYQVYFNGAAVFDEKPEKVGVSDISFINFADSHDGYGVGFDFNEKGQQLDLDGNVVEW